jgi:hypothetical protein
MKQLAMRVLTPIHIQGLGDFLENAIVAYRPALVGPFNLAFGVGLAEPVVLDSEDVNSAETPPLPANRGRLCGTFTPITSSTAQRNREWAIDQEGKLFSKLPAFVAQARQRADVAARAAEDARRLAQSLGDLNPKRLTSLSKDDEDRLAQDELRIQATLVVRAATKTATEATSSPYCQPALAARAADLASRADSRLASGDYSAAIELAQASSKALTPPTSNVVSGPGRRGPIHLG